MTCDLQQGLDAVFLIPDLLPGGGGGRRGEVSDGVGGTSLGAQIVCHELSSIPSDNAHRQNENKLINFVIMKK